MLRTDCTEAPMSKPLSECVLRLLPTWWYSGPGDASSAGIMGSAGAMATEFCMRYLFDLRQYGGTIAVRALVCG